MLITGLFMVRFYATTMASGDMLFFVPNSLIQPSHILTRKKGFDEIIRVKYVYLKLSRSSQWHLVLPGLLRSLSVLRKLPC